MQLTKGDGTVKECRFAVIGSTINFKTKQPINLTLACVADESEGKRIMRHLKNGGMFRGLAVIDFDATGNSGEFAVCSQWGDISGFYV